MSKKAIKWFVLVLLLGSSCQTSIPNPVTTIAPTVPAVVTPSVEPVRSPQALPSATFAFIPSLALTPPTTPSSIKEYTPTATTLPSASQISTETMLVDHRSVELFERIPEEYLLLASHIPILFSDRSVGKNISEGLDCLSAGLPADDPLSSQDWPQIPAHCRRDYSSKQGATWSGKLYGRAEFLAHQVPESILFDPDPDLYDRSEWTFELRSGGWEALVENFVEELVPLYVGSKKVLSFQFTYLNVAEGSGIADPDEGFFVDLAHTGYYLNRERWDISDLENLETSYPDKIFIYWTSSLARSIGSREAMDFNQQMREYTQVHGKILFDVADIESHDEEGNACYDNRDGIEYCGANECENYPDDGELYPAICQDYTTEIDGGHLGSVSAGKIRIAKAFWVLMARIAGWDGS